MNLKQLMWAAVITRVTSFLTLGVFLFSLWYGLEDKVALIALGASYLAFACSVGFVHFYKEAAARHIIAMHVAEIAAKEAIENEDTVKMVPLNDEYPTHPALGDEE